MTSQGQAFDTAYAKVIISRLALSVVLDAHQRVGSRMKQCLCCLMGSINDDGSIFISDAFANRLNSTGDKGEVDLPEKIYHEHMIQAHQKMHARDTVIGWATTSMGGKAIEAVCEWARNEPRSSKFTAHKRLTTPIMVFVTPLSEHNDLKVAAYIKGPMLEGVLKPIPIEIGSVRPGLKYQGVLSSEINASIDLENKTDPTAQVLDKLSERLDEAIALAESGLKGQVCADVGRKLYDAIMPPIPLSLQAFLDAENGEAALYEAVSTALNLQLAVGEKLHVFPNA